MEETETIDALKETVSSNGHCLPDNISSLLNEVPIELPRELAEKVRTAKCDADLAMARLQIAQITIDKLFFECSARMQLNPDLYVLKQMDSNFFFVKK